MARDAQRADGIALIDKPAGPTSHDVVDWVRWGLRTRSVGHCGTLDPAASGLLVVCVGTATRAARYLTDADKTYRARFVLGRATTTADAEGDPVEEAAVPAAAWERAASELEGMVGTLELPPPAFSAVHVGGRRAHELARAGRDVALEPRTMGVLGVEDVVVDAGEASVAATLRVTKGTYVRSLAVELGRRLGVPAHLGGLRRTASGSLTLDRPGVVAGLVAHRVRAGDGRPDRWRIRPADLDVDDGGARAQVGALLADALRSPVDVLDLPQVRPSSDDAGELALRRLGHGQALDLPDPGLAVDRADGRVLVVGPHGELLVARVEPAPSGRRCLQPERRLSGGGRAA